MRNFVFLWFLVSTVLVAVISAIGVLWSGPVLLLAAGGPFEAGIVHYGAEMASLAFDSGGVPAVAELEKRLARQGDVRFFLFDAALAGLGGSAPEAVRAFAGRLNVENEVQFLPYDGALLAGCLIRTPRSVRRMVVLLPTRAHGIPINVAGWIRRILAVLAVAIPLCTWLARRLSQPLLRLREAARKFASGDLNARASAATFPGNPPEYRELARDFDEMAGRIEALVTAQRQLLRDVSHELRTPLTRLSLAVNNARRAPAPDVARSLDRIDQESERLNALVDRILRLSRMEAFDEAPHHETIEFADFIESIVSDADFEAGARNRRVTLLHAEPCRLAGDRELLREAIENVVRNAIRYTPEATTVTVETRREGGEYRIAVRDHGPGVPAGHLDAIFEPFYRAPQRADSDFPGFGIGLAITRRAVALHHGRVAARNLDEGGFEFAISLPAPPARP